MTGFSKTGSGWNRSGSFNQTAKASQISSQKRGSASVEKYLHENTKLEEKIK
jgi:hypothetical protein